MRVAVNNNGNLDVNKANDPSCLEIDIVVVWMGNELCGRRGVFLDPGTPQWQIGPEGYAAAGLWPEIAGRVCGEIGRLAALQGRPVVGSVQILGDADPVDYSLPPEYREAIHKFMGYARSRGLYTSSIRTAVSSIPKHDHYHFREDSTHRSTLALLVPCGPKKLLSSPLLHKRLTYKTTIHLHPRYPTIGSLDLQALWAFLHHIGTLRGGGGRVGDCTSLNRLF